MTALNRDDVKNCEYPNNCLWPNCKCTLDASRVLIERELWQAAEVLRKFMSNPVNIKSIQNAADLMVARLKTGGKIIACGNGGSMSDAMHFASELTGRFKNNRPAIPALAISDPGHLSCVANDFGYDEVFSRFLEAHARQGDVLLAISTSGNSKNVLQSVLQTERHSIDTVFLTGSTGGDIREVLSPADIEINVPSDQTARIQELHIKIIHILVMLIEKGLGYDK